MTRRAPRALALTEVVVSVAIMGGLTAAVLTAVGAAATTRARTLERLQGGALAESLVAEVLASAYDAPTPPPPLLSGSINLLGITVSLNSPSGDPSRLGFASVDHFDGWRSSPPLARDGTVIPGYAGWTQDVRVIRVEPANPDGPDAGADTGLKRVSVRILRDGREVAHHVALRSRGWDTTVGATP